MSNLKVKASHIVEFAILFLFGLGCCAEADDWRLEYQKLLRAEEKLIESEPNLIAVQKQYPDDPGIQSGIGFLYREVFAFNPDPRVALRRALAVDPNCRPARAMLEMLNITAYCIQRNSDLEDFQNRAENARRRGYEFSLSTFSDQHARYFRNDPLWKDKSGRFPIQDVEKAYKIIEEKLNQEGWELLEQVEKAQKHDPNNSLYHYFKIPVYFLLEEPRKTLNELREGMKKPLRMYMDYQSEKKELVLELAGFPEEMRGYFTDLSYRPFENFLYDRVWSSHLKGYVDMLIEKEEYSAAEEVCEMVLYIAGQCPPRPVIPSRLASQANLKLHEIEQQRGIP